VLDRKENADDLHEIAVIEGDRWLARNEKYYSGLSNLNQIVRWDQWLKHDEYQNNQTKLRSIMQEDETYKKIFDDTIHQFLGRYCSRVDEASFDLERAHRLCFEYLLEECTAMTLWPQLNCHFEVYPSKRNFAMDETHKRFVLPEYPELLHAVAIKFKNRKQLKPQHFSVISEVLEERV